MFPNENQSRERGWQRLAGAFPIGASVSEVMMQTAKSGNQSRDRKGAVNGAAGGTALEQWHTPGAPAAQGIVGRYRAAVETVAGYMGRAAALLEDLYAEQDGMIEQLKRLLSKSKSLRRSDFDAIFANLLARQLRTREMLSTLVAGYRAHRETLIQGIEDLCAADAHAANAQIKAHVCQFKAEVNRMVGAYAQVSRERAAAWKQTLNAVRGRKPGRVHPGAPGRRG